jgi:hypothetical protein
LAFIAVCLGSLGMGGWAYMASAEVTERVKKLDDLRRQVDSARGTRANSRIIDERKKQVEEYNAEFERAMNAALAVQKTSAFHAEVDADGKAVAPPRALLIDKVLPKPTKAQAINFKEAYATAFGQLKQRLNGRDKPTTKEVTEMRSALGGAKTTTTVDLGPWGPPDEAPASRGKKERPFQEILKENARTMAADKVARGIRMYVADNALMRQSKVLSMDVPTEVEIWQAQMSLWIQQDIVAILTRFNDDRAEQLQKSGKADQLWVAYMPVKNFIALRIDSKLGKGGGSNPPKVWPASFTGVKNDDKLFVVPLQLELVVEEASLIELLDRICAAGFYTPININYDAIKPNPLYEDYVYGEQPVIKITLTLEAYYFRSVFEDWIPASLKKALKTPGAEEPKP